jgi:biotin operon repressor/hypoxanthine-guanine phosphoribosyltransferase
MKIKTSEQIKIYLKEKNRVTGNELADYLGISTRAVRKQLFNLLEKGEIYKMGMPPKVFYSLNTKIKEVSLIKINAKDKKIIDQNYIIITPGGEMKSGLEGFAYWCQKNNLEVGKTAKEYIETLKKYKKFKKGNLIDGLQKFKNTFEKVYLDKIFYIDFYSIERFGKTKLGQMLLYGKQSGNKKIIKQIVEEIKPKINSLIKRYKVDAVGFVPWTVKREVQFMRELEKGLSLNIKIIKIDKIRTEVIVPQKTLSKLPDRIENAKKTLVMTESGKYKNLLIIDDAVGSGATINYLAEIAKEKKVAQKVIGLSITGSFKGFDVISEV